ncbi:MAG: hypothetical protein ACK587_11450 [Cyanobacteriota bacterium]
MNGAGPTAEAPATGDSPIALKDQPDPVPSRAPDDRSHSAATVTPRPPEAAAPAAQAPSMEPASPSAPPFENTPMPSPAEASGPPSTDAFRSATPSAREEVNGDGTLRRPSRPSPLARLRERLGR